MTITYTGVNGGSFINFLIGPQPGDAVTANSIGVGLQGAANGLKRLYDTKADLVGADFTGSITTTGDLGVTGHGIFVGYVSTPDLRVATILSLSGDMTIAAGKSLTFGSAAIWAGGTIASSATINQSGAYAFTGGLIPGLDPARTWLRRARLYASSIDAGVSQGLGGISPLFDSPSIYSRAGSASPVYLYLELDPPHGAVITAVAVRSVIGTNPLGAFTRATYELVRWNNGLDLAYTSLSAVATDAHLANGSDWNTVLTTNLASISSSAVARTHLYGLRIAAPSVGGTALDQWYDVLVTGTIAELNGQ